MSDNRYKRRIFWEIYCMTLRHAQSCNTISIVLIHSSSGHLQDNLFAEARNAFEYHEGEGARHHFSIHSQRTKNSNIRMEKL